MSQERLRFARDLHDLLGFSLSAITLKVELARRLIGEQTERALRELAEVLGIAREALTDVRAVASSYRELSLADEIESARSVLTAAGVATTIETDLAELSPRSRTVLATVLREGVTNLLRHSEATRCTITVSGTGPVVSIDIVNDGAPARLGTDRGSGLANLATRATAIGGSLRAEVDAGTHRLHAEVPAEPRPEEPSRTRRFAGTPMATRFAQVLFTAVVVGYGLMSLAQVAFDLPRIGLPGMAAEVLGTAGVVGLVVAVVGRPHKRLNLVSTVAVLAGLAVCVYVPVLLYGNALMSVPGFLAGSAALLLPRPYGWAAFLAVVGGQYFVYTATGFTGAWVAYGIIAATNHGLVLYALTRLRSMVTELHEAREELATAAVAQERLRFARDLHDLLGYSLSAITLKSELTHRLVTLDPGRARQELLRGAGDLPAGARGRAVGGAELPRAVVRRGDPVGAGAADRGRHRGHRADRRVRQAAQGREGDARDRAARGRDEPAAAQQGRALRDRAVELAGAGADGHRQRRHPGDGVQVAGRQRHRQPHHPRPRARR
ncbi:histidine kinase [Lentzea chajnantorensis]